MKKKKVSLRFDELNSLEVDYDYFEPMQISKYDKDRRRELSDYLTDAFVFFFSVFDVHRHHNSLLTKQLYQRLLADRISEAVANVTGIDSYMSKHIKDVSREVVNTTFKYVTETSSPNPSDTPNSYITPKHPNSPTSEPQYQTSDGFISNSNDESPDIYWLSYRRAEDIARSEANTFLNYSDFLEAKERGATKKTWLTMLDDKVRDTHEEVEGQTIGIDELFTVGNSLMKFPHDLSESPDPKEVINCRCAVDYI